ncbi:hypothetical protein E2I00_002794 [Balaenoptera physalus]|uniref:TAFII55 protein conserved region domain-containing protein n=1 Tax=Balaenoptera physalus TaxID=9770 RepID=A0A643C627_BALPH|nr:hypothetical protein E2I00_002794 [Balaenoptera physalus]
MERPKGRRRGSSGNDLTPTSTSEVTSLRYSRTAVDGRAQTAGGLGVQTAICLGARTPANYGAQAHAAIGNQAAARTPLENLREGEEMSRSQDEPPCELEDQFILRLPLEHASTVRKIVRSGSAAMKDKLKIDLLSGGRDAVVGVEGVSLPAKLVDLPCVIESLKTLDKKTFFKTADISQLLHHLGMSGREGSAKQQKRLVVPDFKQIEEVSSPEEEDISARHRVLSDVTGIPSPTLVQHIDSPDVEKQVKRLLCSDTEAVSVRWEVVAEGETEEIESQGFIPGFEIASEMSGYKQRHTSPEYGAFWEMVNDSSSNRDEVEGDKEEDEEGEDDYDDEDEDKKEEEDRYEVYMESEPQAKFIESGQYEAKEGTSPMVMDIQKQTHYMEKNLQEIQHKAQRQKELIMKVENLMLKEQ